MRISDWSSDVCSSDLLRFDVVASSLADDVKARLLERSDRRITSDGVIVIKAQQHRKQEQNLDAALERLRLLIAAAEPAPRVRRATRPSKSAKRRRPDHKTHRGRTKGQPPASDDHSRDNRRGGP